jgi:cell division protein FtsQ
VIETPDITASDGVDNTAEPVVQPAPLSRRQRLLAGVASVRALKPPFPVQVRWPRLMTVALVLSIASLAVMIALLNSPLLDIGKIEVEGAEVVSAASVRQLVGLKGQHVMLADLQAAQQRVAALPMVKEVNVLRDWPNGIKVVIVERKPWGRWRAEDTVWTIDAEGVILDGAAPSFSGPIVTQVSALPAIKAGAVVDLSAVDMVAELHQRGAPLPLPSVLAYEWSLTDGLVVVTEHGRIVFGDADGLDYKYEVWDLLEREAQQRGEPLLFADLRFGLRPRVEIGLNVGRDIRIHDRTTASITD